MMFWIKLKLLALILSYFWDIGADLLIGKELISIALYAKNDQFSGKNCLIEFFMKLYNAPGHMLVWPNGCDS